MKETKFIYRYNYSKIIHQTICSKFHNEEKTKITFLRKCAEIFIKTSFKMFKGKSL